MSKTISSKTAAILFFVASGMFYLTAFINGSTRAVYISLGSVFLILGIIRLRGAGKSE